LFFIRFFNRKMEHVIKGTGALSINDTSYFLGSDYENSTETLTELDDDYDGDANQHQMSGCQETLSWGSEMSLFDLQSPRRTLGSLRMLSTPSYVATPQEFKEINWKSVDFEKISVPRTEIKSFVEPPFIVDKAGGLEKNGEKLQNSNRCEPIDEVNISKWKLKRFEPAEEEESKSPTSSVSGKEEVGKSITSGPRETADVTSAEKSGRLELVEDAQSEPERCKTLSERSEQDYSVPSCEPIFDYTNLLVNYLPPDMDTSLLRNLFTPYGTIESCKVVLDHVSGRSKGYGFVKYQTAAEGKNAQKALHQFLIGRKKLKVSFSRLPLGGEKTKHHTNLYLSNLDPHMDQEDLERHFKTCGYVVQCKVLKNTQGASKQIGFVRFDNSDSARLAIERFDGKQLEGTDRPINIRIAYTPRAPPRRGSPVSRFSFPTHVSTSDYYPVSSACYVAGFDMTLSENDLRHIFEPGGRRKVRSVRIIRRQNGPYAFINFFDGYDAVEAAKTLNNVVLGNYTLTVRLQT